MIIKQWDSYKEPDSVCQDCFYCMKYELSGGTQYLCNCVDSTPDACLNLDHEYFLNRSEHLTTVSEMHKITDNTYKQVANILGLITDFCRNTACRYCPFSGEDLICSFDTVANVTPSGFPELTKRLKGE